MMGLSGSQTDGMALTHRGPLLVHIRGSNLVPRLASDRSHGDAFDFRLVAERVL